MVLDVEYLVQIEYSVGGVLRPHIDRDVDESLHTLCLVATGRIMYTHIYICRLDVMCVESM